MCTVFALFYNHVHLYSSSVFFTSKEKASMQSCIFVCCSSCRTVTYFNTGLRFLTGSAASTHNTDTLFDFLRFLLWMSEPFGHSLHISGLLTDHITTPSGSLSSCSTIISLITVYCHSYLSNICYCSHYCLKITACINCFCQQLLIARWRTQCRFMYNCLLD